MHGLRFSLLLLLGLSGCQSNPDDAMPTADTAAVQDAAMGNGETALVDTEFNPHLGDYIATLASDAFQGRQPASVGEEKTIAFLTERFQAAGLEPGYHGSYTQSVPLVEITAVDAQPVVFTHGEQRLELSVGPDVVTWTKRVEESVQVSASDVVFVGYGVVAPEYQWDDYAGIDVRGKTVLILVNDPGFVSEDDALFRGRTMTYYGRWTYKFEEAARQGAAMALLIHDTAAAGYGFDVVQGSWSGAQFDLVREDKNRDRVAVEGWIEQSAAQRLFQSVGLKLDELAAAAARPGFQAQALPMQASTAIRNQLRESLSNNVVALLPGRSAADEYFIYTAHWDHLGVNAELDDDTIYNGAQDNASGTAALLALAENLAQGERPERSMVFVAVTAEESGLLGSRYFADNPPFPLSQVVAGVNMDALNIHGPMRDLVVVGHGNSELEPMVAKLAQAQNRRVEPNPFPEKGFYYRSDHFNLAKHGVPMLYAKGGVDHFEKGQAYGREQNAEYVNERYHKPADEYGDWWDLRGMNQDLHLFQRLGLELANSDHWPNWYEGNEFRAIRDASRAQGQAVAP